MTTRPSHQARVGQTLADRLERDARGQDAVGTSRAEALAKTMREAAAALRIRPGVEEIARAIFDAENVPENQVSWDEWIVYTKTKSFLGKEIELCRRRARAVAALLDAFPCNSTDVVSHDGANLRDNGWQPIAGVPPNREVLLWSVGSKYESPGIKIGRYEWLFNRYVPIIGCTIYSTSAEQFTHWTDAPSAPPHVAPKTNVERDGGAS